MIRIRTLVYNLPNGNMRFSSKFNVMVFNDNVNTHATVYLSWENGLNPGITHLDWKRSSGWLESWKGLLSSVTDVSTTCAVAIFRVKWPISRKQKFFSGLQSRTGDDLFQSKLSISFIVYIYFNGATTSAFVTYFVNNREWEHRGIIAKKSSRLRQMFIFKSNLRCRCWLISLSADDRRVTKLQAFQAQTPCCECCREWRVSQEEGSDFQWPSWNLWSCSW